MNFLAHLYLARPREVAPPLELVGNLMPDLVRGRLPADLPAPVAAGVDRHRAVDRWCDAHPAFGRTRRRLTSSLAPTQGRFAGIVADVLFDHALSLRWSEHHELPLPDFIASCYAGLTDPDATAVMPPRMAAAVTLMVEQDWLGRYRTDAGLTATFRQMSERFSQRFDRAVSLDTTIEHLPQQRDALLSDFDELFASLVQRIDGIAKPARRYDPGMTTTTSVLKPVALGLTPSFGFGDRLGLATPGHLAALKADGGPIAGIFAQQSIREMTRTQRSATEVMTAAVAALSAAGFDQSWGADADHLKTPADVDVTADAGFVFFTIDPSDHVDQKADNYDAATVDAKYIAPPWAEQYLGQTLKAGDTVSLTFDELTVKRAAVKYGKAIEHALELAAYIKSAAEQRGQPHEIEVSIDETDQPTTLHEHYIIADQLRQAGVNVVSLAPRFIGELEKGVDYIGDVAALEASLADHAAIAEHLGPYKLSLHSGSDKLSMYPALGRATKGRFHVKTAGTSYLEALRVVAIEDVALFRRIVDFSRDHYDTDKATYHVHATLGSAAPQGDIKDDHALIGEYLEHWDDVPANTGFTKPGRQILHCTFGSVVTDTDLGPALRQCLAEHPGTYEAVLKDHFARHLQALRAG